MNRISKTEKQILEFIKNRLDYIFVISITILSLLIRLSLRNATNSDISTFLIPWYEQIKSNGGIWGGLGQPVYSINGTACNYSFIYQFFIAVMASLPIAPVHAYKAFSVIFDYLIALAVAGIIWHLTNGTSKQAPIIGYTIVLLHPVVFLNSAMWGQCDAIYTFCILLSFLAILRDKNISVFIYFGLAISFKLQAIFFLPFILFYYFYKKSFSILYFVISVITVFITNVPALIQGRSIGEALVIYTGNVGLYNEIAMNYPSFWVLLCSAIENDNISLFKGAAILVTIGILGIHMYIWIGSKPDIKGYDLTNFAFLLIYTAVLFMPGMHERYGYIYEIMAIVLLFLSKKFFIPYILISFLSIRTYGAYLFGSEINLAGLAVVNVIAYVIYCVLIYTDFYKKTSHNK